MGPLASSVWTQKQFRNPGEADCSDDCSEANPAPSGWSKRHKAEAITQGSKSAKDVQWSCETAVNATATGSVNQTRSAHHCECSTPQNRSQRGRYAKAERARSPRCT